jgi:hypothetical protein
MIKGRQQRDRNMKKSDCFCNGEKRNFYDDKEK